MPELIVDAIAHGGEAVGRIAGKAHFVAGAIPGERVTIEVTRNKARWARGRMVDIVEPSPDRIEAPCPAYEQCGGCTWQHVSYRRQLEWKRDVVAGQLAHLGGLNDVPVRPTMDPGRPYGYRNRMDFAVREGRPALHEHRSSRLVDLDACLLLHPELTERFDALGDLSGVRKLVLRCGVNTGDVLILIEGRVPGPAATWDASVVARTRDGLRTIRGRPWFEESIEDLSFRVPASAFFQVNTVGAEALVRIAREAASPVDDDVLLDGYAGVGLFGATIGRAVRRVVTIDAGKAAYRVIGGNLERAIPGRFSAFLGPFEAVARSIRDRWSIAIVDPPRAGLGADGVTAVTAAAPHTIVLISCDAASLARDASLLTDNGYRIDWVQPVDLFPQTYHIETVTRFVLR